MRTWGHQSEDSRRAKHTSRHHGFDQANENTEEDVLAHTVHDELGASRGGGSRDPTAKRTRGDGDNRLMRSMNEV